MTIKEFLGAERYEQIRATIQGAFPGPGNQVPDGLVDAFIHEVHRQSPTVADKLGFPVSPPAPDAVPHARDNYPLYIAHAFHARVLAMDSTKPFNSAFVGRLPKVRVPLPPALSFTTSSVSTPIGTVDFARDHLAGSVALVTELYAAELGYAPARVDLITPARELGARFGAIAIYLGYRNAADTAPSFYILEAGLATGQAAMLYLGKTMDATIIQAAGYLPTPFSNPQNTYWGQLQVQNDQPVRLVIQANAPRLPHYIQVTVDYEAVSARPDTLPIALTVQAIERVCAIGDAMGVPLGLPIPKLVEDVLAEIAVLFLSWVEKPGSGAAKLPDSHAGGVHSPLLQRLSSLGHELVQNFEAKTHPMGTSSVSGRPVEMATTVKEDLEKLLQDVSQLRDASQGRELVTRFAKLVSAVELKTKPTDLATLPNGAAVVAAMGALALGTGADGSITGTGPRQTWANQLANQKVQPLSIFAPVSLNSPSDPQSIEVVLTRALATGCAVKAAGSGHSYSDVATTPDFFIDTHGLNQVANVEAPLTGQLSAAVLRSPLPLALGPVGWSSYDPDKHLALIEMEAGITIRALNAALESRNLGLRNMGGYDGQTIVGASSTSTHGSGIGLGPFPDMIRSLVLATTGRWNGKTLSGQDPGNGVYYYRIEPSDGITDPAKYSDPIIQLIQDDDCYSSVICNMGCFGVIYSVVLEVMQMYWLSETRSLTTLAQVMSDLAPNPANPGSVPDVLLNTRNYEVLIHPYPMKGFEIVPMDPNQSPETYYPYFTCLVTKRNIAPQPNGPPPHGHRPTPDWLGRLLALLLDKEPWFTPEAIDISLLTLIDTDYVDTSFAIYNLGLGGGVGFAAEIGFSLEDGRGAYSSQNFQAAIDRIHLIAQRALEQGKQYQTSAFSLRFVKGSLAHLSMMQGRNTAMIEMDMLTGTYGGAEIMYRYETNMYALGGRPHWGLEFDSLSGNNDLLGKMYPKLGRWLSVYRQFNALGTFDNAFTQRMGFTVLA